MDGEDVKEEQEEVGEEKKAALLDLFAYDAVAASDEYGNFVAMVANPTGRQSPLVIGSEVSMDRDGIRTARSLRKKAYRRIRGERRPSELSNGIVPKSDSQSCDMRTALHEWKADSAEETPALLSLPTMRQRRLLLHASAAPPTENNAARGVSSCSPAPATPPTPGRKGSVRCKHAQPVSRQIGRTFAEIDGSVLTWART